MVAVMMMNSNSAKNQRGGTLLGVIVGGVVGLAVAALVAVYVTKVPVPFMNARTAVGGPERDASEARKNKDWDPNGTLASKARVTAPAAAETPNLGTSARALPALPAEAPPVVVAKADPRAPRAGADPLGELARSRAGSSISSSSGTNNNSGNDSAAEPFAYFVQAGAFQGATEADAQRAKLAIMGWEARVTEREQAGRTVYRVRVGPFGRKDDAERTKEKLDDAGMQTALVRVNK